MRIVLIETAAPDAPGSMRRYADLLATALESVPDVEYRRVAVAPTSLQLLRFPRRLRTVVHHALIAFRTMGLSRRHPADIYHVLDGSHGYLLHLLPRTRTVVTVHDIIPELQLRGLFPLPPPGIGARWIIRAGLRGIANARHVIADSQSTRNNLEEYAQIPGARVHLVHLAVPPELMPSTGEELARSESYRREEPPFVLHVGNNGFYKNRAGVVRVFDHVRRKSPIRLKLAGPAPDAALRNLIKSLGIESLIDYAIDPNDAEMKNLYCRARLLLFPSLYEGFGWPPVEAMAWGCPVVCSSNGSLEEVVHHAALTADATAEFQMAENCLSILDDPTIANRLSTVGLQRATDFSIERFREQMITVYRSIKGFSVATHFGVQPDHAGVNRT